MLINAALLLMHFILNSRTKDHLAHFFPNPAQSTLQSLYINCHLSNIYTYVSVYLFSLHSDINEIKVKLINDILF